METQEKDYTKMTIFAGYCGFILFRMQLKEI
jgi:hypothetical protein